MEVGEIGDLWASGPSAASDTTAISEIAIPLKTRYLEISGYELMMTRADPAHIARFHRIPEDAVVEKILERDVTRYRWRVLSPRTEDEMEFLFDMEQFEPL